MIKFLSFENNRYHILKKIKYLIELEKSERIFIRRIYGENHYSFEDRFNKLYLHVYEMKLKNVVFMIFFKN